MCQGYIARRAIAVDPLVGTKGVEAELDLHTAKNVSSSPPSNNKRAHRGVWFAPELAQVVGPPFKAASQMTIEEKSDLWYQKWDYQYMSRSAEEVAKMVYKIDVGASDESSYSSTIMRTYSSLRGDAFLVQWMKTTSCRRGLERQSIPLMGNHRYKRQRMLVRGVLEIQDAFDGELHPSLVVLCFSRPRAFARIMGQADEYAAQSDFIPPNERVEGPAPVKAIGLQELPKPQASPSCHEAAHNSSGLMAIAAAAFAIGV